MPPCDPYEGETEVSGVWPEDITITGEETGSFLRVRVDHLGAVGFRLGDGGDQYASVWFAFGEVAKVVERLAAPLLAEAERRGAERGWDEGWRFGTGMFAVLEPLANPYRAGVDQ